MTQPTTRLLLTSLVTMALAACGGADRPAGEAPADTCTYDGKIYRVGETFPDRDGCNSCSCAPEGETCTAMRCDGAPPPTDEDTCEYDGETYHTGDTFPATDGCNTCACNPEGTRGVGCSLKDCDAVPPAAVTCPDEAPAHDAPCSAADLECKYVTAHCPDHPYGEEYAWERAIYRCVGGLWRYEGQDCYDCCRFPSDQR